jgi:hypothetical protein
VQNSSRRFAAVRCSCSESLQYRLIPRSCCVDAGARAGIGSNGVACHKVVDKDRGACRRYVYGGNVIGGDEVVDHRDRSQQAADVLAHVGRDGYRLSLVDDRDQGFEGVGETAWIETLVFCVPFEELPQTLTRSRSIDVCERFEGADSGPAINVWHPARRTARCDGLLCKRSTGRGISERGKTTREKRQDKRGAIRCSERVGNPDDLLAVELVYDPLHRSLKTVIVDRVLFENCQQIGGRPHIVRRAAL